MKSSYSGEGSIEGSRCLVGDMVVDACTVHACGRKRTCLAEAFNVVALLGAHARPRSDAGDAKMQTRPKSYQHAHQSIISGFTFAFLHRPDPR